MLSSLRALLMKQYGPMAPWIEPQRRQVLERAYTLILFAEGMGAPILPIRLRLCILPHVVPQIMNWKRLAGRDGWETQIKRGC